MNTTVENEVIYTAKLHWILFAWPIGLGVIAMILGILFETFKTLALIFVLIALLWGLTTWVNYHFSSLTIQRKRVILRTGILVRNTVDIPLTKIESIDIKQSIIGSILRYGYLMITGTGGTRYFVNYIDKPLTCRRYIEQLMHDE